MSNFGLIVRLSSMYHLDHIVLLYILTHVIHSSHRYVQTATKAGPNTYKTIRVIADEYNCKFTTLTCLMGNGLIVLPSRQIHCLVHRRT